MYLYKNIDISGYINRAKCNVIYKLQKENKT